VNSLVLGGTGFVGRRLVEVLVAENTRGPLFSRPFTPVHHGMLDASKITTALGVMPSYDLRTGHANTLEWYRRSGAAAVETARSDPLWNRTFDFGYEAEVAAHVRNAPLRKDA
jgi:nucleoside-diphosphate-sugar epimerase